MSELYYKYEAKHLSHEDFLAKHTPTHTHTHTHWHLV